MRRANGKGCSNEVDAVTPKPRCSVTEASAGTSCSGSFTGTCTPPASAASGLPP